MPILKTISYLSLSRLEKWGTQTLKKKTVHRNIGIGHCPHFNPSTTPLHSLMFGGGDNPYLTNNRNPGTGVIDESVYRSINCVRMIIGELVILIFA